jgi:hypothetical protein
LKEFGQAAYKPVPLSDWLLGVTWLLDAIFPPFDDLTVEKCLVVALLTVLIAARVDFVCLIFLQIRRGVSYGLSK